MNIPKRVAAQLQAAEALELQLQEAHAAGPHLVSDVSTLVPQAANEPPSEPQQPAAPPPAPAAPQENFEAKYKTLQGMYTSDVTQVRRQMAEVTQTAQQLAATVRELQEAREAAPVAPAVDPKDVEDFGQGLVDMVLRYVDGKNWEGRIAALEQRVNGVTQQTQEQTQRAFYATLRHLVPKWEEINADPRWLAWLGVEDEVYGVPRQAALDRGFKALDAERVANVFRAYVASLPVEPVVESLASQQAPSTVSSPQPTPAAPKPLLSSKAIELFYRDVAQGKFKGREAEYAAMEQQINEAVAENRVR